MKAKQKQKVKALKSLAGRVDWQGVKPVTKVQPNKKKGKPDRKAKHKGRLNDSRPFLLLGHAFACASVHDRLGVLPAGTKTAALRHVRQNLFSLVKRPQQPLP